MRMCLVHSSRTRLQSTAKDNIQVSKKSAMKRDASREKRRWKFRTKSRNEAKYATQVASILFFSLTFHSLSRLLIFTTYWKSINVCTLFSFGTFTTPTQLRFAVRIGRNSAIDCYCSYNRVGVHFS